MIRSDYSLLDSTIRIAEIASQAKKMGFAAAVLSDHNTMHGAPAFLKACRSEGIKPIFGLEADILYHEQTVQFLLLAKDNTGLKNLIHLSSALCENDQPASYEQLCTAAQHCVLIAYGEGGFIDSELIREDRDALRQKLSLMKNELPPFYMALSYQESGLWKIKNALLKRCCQPLGIRTAAVNKIYYLNENDDAIYQIACGIRLQKTLNEKSLPKVKGRFMRSIQQMEEIYDADDLAATDLISSECNADMNLEKTSLPVYQAPAPLTAGQYLTQLCLAGLKKRLQGQDNPAYLSRLKYELRIILQMHFENYFLIVWDFIRFARKQDIFVGPGRGSAAGSLVAYSLGITQVDPIRHHLIFERFLNPERISMPDIDTDFPDNRRDEVIQYVYQKYGQDHIANIVTFGTLGARQVLRDVGKVLNIPARGIDTLCRLIPNTPRMTLKTALKQSSRLNQIVHAEKQYQILFDYALRMEGMPRHCSIHAAGIVMSELPLEQVVPTMQMSDGMKTCQYTMEYLEERGLIKMDFLGLRNLTITDEIVKNIRRSDPDFSVYGIPEDDAETFDLISNCNTLGVFQLESEGMKNLIKKMQPRSFDELAAALALFRPGPMENIPLYLQNKKNPEKIEYPAEELKPILKDTYGVMIYQEQIMQVAQIAAGFTLGRADLLRRAMAKKKEKDIISMKSEFISGCIRNGYPSETAEKLFYMIQKFAGYGFNKSHAVAYAMIAYPQAYLKCKYPLYFYSALLDGVIGDEDKCTQYIDECIHRNIKIEGPDINRSAERCIQSERSILLPLSMIKNVGFAVAMKIAEERRKGPYTDLFDFSARMSLYKINRRAFEQLIYAGALDCFQQSRKTLLHALDDAENYAELVKIDQNGQCSIDLGLVSKPVMMKMQDSEEERAENEKNALGFCLGPAPIIHIRKLLGITDQSLIQVKNLRNEIYSFAMISNVHPHRTRKGEMMAFLKVIDETAELDMAVMPSLYRNKQQDLVKGTYIRFHGRISEDGSCLCNELKAVYTNRTKVKK